MAKIVAEFDTVTKTLVVTRDGQPVPDLNEVSFYRCEKLFAMTIRQVVESGDMQTRTYVTASLLGQSEHENQNQFASLCAEAYHRLKADRLKAGQH